MRYISGTKLDERVIRCDLDPGYRDGRQYGRGKSGGQVRDEYRQEYDAGRGGWGHNRLREEEERKRREQVYREEGNTHAGGGGGLVPAGAEGDYEEREGAQRGHDDADAPKRARSQDPSDRGDEPAKNPRFREDDDQDQDLDEPIP